MGSELSDPINHRSKIFENNCACIEQIFLPSVPQQYSTATIYIGFHCVRYYLQRKVWGGNA
jgi:hypothetical protein